MVRSLKGNNPLVFFQNAFEFPWKFCRRKNIQGRTADFTFILSLLRGGNKNWLEPLYARLR